MHERWFAFAARRLLCARGLGDHLPAHNDRPRAAQAAPDDGFHRREQLQIWLLCLMLQQCHEQSRQHRQDRTSAENVWQQQRFKQAVARCQGVPADVASKLPEEEVVSRTLAQLNSMFGEVAPQQLVLKVSSAE